MSEPVHTVKVPCVSYGCLKDAIARVRLNTGWANFCRTCYDDRYLAGAKSRLKWLGLQSVDEMKAYCMEKSREPNEKGNGWAKVIMGRAVEGLPVSEYALSVARKAIESEFPE